MTAAIAGVGYTAFTKESDRSVLDLAVEACSSALDDAGLEADEVDGMASFMVMHDSVPCQAVATCLAIPELQVALDLDLGGQAPCYLVWLAANLVEAGAADAIVVFRAMNGRSAARVGTMQFAGMGGQFRYPIGYDAYLMYVAMWGQRFLFETGQGEADLAGVVLNQRQYDGRQRAGGQEASPRPGPVPGVAHGRGTLPSRRLHRRGGRRLRVGGHVARPGP